LWALINLIHSMLLFRALWRNMKINSQPLFAVVASALVSAKRRNAREWAGEDERGSWAVKLKLTHLSWRREGYTKRPSKHLLSRIFHRIRRLKDSWSTLGQEWIWGRGMVIIIQNGQLVSSVMTRKMALMNSHCEETVLEILTFLLADPYFFNKIFPSDINKVTSAFVSLKDSAFQY